MFVLFYGIPTTFSSKSHLVKFFRAHNNIKTVTNISMAIKMLYIERTMVHYVSESR